MTKRTKYQCDIYHRGHPEKRNFRWSQILRKPLVAYQREMMHAPSQYQILLHLDNLRSRITLVADEEEKDILLRPAGESI